MSHFLCIASGENTLPIMREIVSMPGLWDADKFSLRDLQQVDNFLQLRLVMTTSEILAAADGKRGITTTAVQNDASLPAASGTGHS